MLVHLVYDERMALHRPVSYQENNENEDSPPSCRADIKSSLATYVFERPERLNSIYSHLMQAFGESSLLRIDCPMATKEQIVSVHSAYHYESMQATAALTAAELEDKSNLDDDMYYNEHSFNAAKLACGGVIAACHAVMTNTNSTSIALVRPPGHHACQAHEMGFCIFNSVAVAAKWAGRRTVILDWDIHHGNGTQELVWGCDNIMYISMHRFGLNKQYFFPGTGSPQETNDGKNINIAWTKGSMGNAEYAAAMSEIVLPMIGAHTPELIIVSCGLDAAKNDLIGDCHLTPEFYGSMTASLLQLNIPLVVALEGGYNIQVICQCMHEITNSMVKHESTDSCLGGLSSARESLRSYWSYEDQHPRLARSAVMNIHATMDALEKGGMEFVFRRIDMTRTPKKSRRKETSTSVMRTRGASKRDELSDLSQLMSSIAL